MSKLKQQPILDTGFLVALLSSKDVHHGWAKQHVSQFHKGCVTCEAVITETLYLLRASLKAKTAIIAMIESGWLQILPILPEMRVAVTRILETYHPRSDYADACMVALYETLGSTVWTTDKKDFLTYKTRSGKHVFCDFAQDFSEE